MDVVNSVDSVEANSSSSSGSSSSSTSKKSGNGLEGVSSECSDEEAELERRAAASLLTPGVAAEEPQLLLSDQVNNASGHQRDKTPSLLEHTATNSLFNKLHICGLQQRSLPSEFTPTCISSILLTTKAVLSSEPICLQLSSPMVLFGDLHGEFHVLAKLADILGRPPSRSYLFLGDYVDRGPHSLETLLYLMLFQALHPQHVFVLRGNHEDRRIYRMFNFEDDLIRIFGLAQGQNLSSLFNTVLCYLPVCAILNTEIFCCHGGLSPHFNHNRFATNQNDFVRRINDLPKPVLFRRCDFVSDLLWADPLDLDIYRMPNLKLAGSTIDEWLDIRIHSLEVAGGRAGKPVTGGSGKSRSDKEASTSVIAAGVDPSDSADGGQMEPFFSAIDWLPNPRGCSYVFSRTACEEFMRRYHINWIVRGHMFVSRGYRESLNGRCITLFSAPDYAQKYHNSGAVFAIEGPSTNGRVLPGRLLRFSKSSLLSYSSALPQEPDMWPHEIMYTSRQHK